MRVQLCRGGSRALYVALQPLWWRLTERLLFHLLALSPLPMRRFGMLEGKGGAGREGCAFNGISSGKPIHARKCRRLVIRMRLHGSLRWALGVDTRRTPWVCELSPVLLHNLMSLAH